MNEYAISTTPMNPAVQSRWSVNSPQTIPITQTRLTIARNAIHVT